MTCNCIKIVSNEMVVCHLPNEHNPKIHEGKLFGNTIHWDQEFKRGDQVAYIPSTTSLRNKHGELRCFDELENMEYGFVTNMANSPGYVFVRYWSKTNLVELRTKGCSEVTPIKNIVLYKSKPQEEIDLILESL